MPHQMDVTVLYLTVVIFHSSGLPVTVNQIIGKSITDVVYLEGHLRPNP